MTDTDEQERLEGAIDVLDKVLKDPVDEGDHDKFAHYVDADKLTDAMVFGIPLVALCGKKWIPSRDAKKFPVCPECKEIWEGLEDDINEG